MNKPTPGQICPCCGLRYQEYKKIKQGDVAEIESLREAMTIYRLGYDQAAEYIGIAGTTVRRWLRGDNEPSKIYKKVIVAGIEKMRAKLEARP